MKAVNTFLIIAIFVNFTNSYGQNGNPINILNNDSIKFSLYNVSLIMHPNWVIEPSKLCVKVALDDDTRKELIKFKYNQWMELLANPRTDWAANIVLYDLFKIDATEYIVIKNRADWIRTIKKRDTAFWKLNLKKRSFLKKVSKVS